MKVLTKLASIAVMAMTMTSTSCSCSGDHNYGPADTSKTPVALENIMTRTSVRQYTGKQIPADTVEILLKAAMAAPTAVNAQPWHFVVVNDPAKRKAIADVSSQIGDKIKTAGAVIVVCGDSNRFFKEQPEYWVQDCSAATENLLLAANACNLGAVWCGIYPDTERVEALRNALGLPANLIPLNVVPVGYPAAVNNPKDKWDSNKVTTL